MSNRDRGDRRIYQDRTVESTPVDRTPDRVPRVDRNQIYNQSLVNQNPKAANGQPVSQTEVYREGYLQGKQHERYVEEELRNRDNENAARGMLLGIVFASLASAIAAALFLANQTQTSTPVAPVVAPVNVQPPAPSPQTNTTQIQERVIERTQELVPIPQPQAPTTTSPQPGSNPAPASQSAPTTQTAPTQTAPTQPQAQPNQGSQGIQESQGTPGSQGIQESQGTPGNGVQPNSNPTGTPN